MKFPNEFIEKTGLYLIDDFEDYENRLVQLHFIEILLLSANLRLFCHA